MGVVDKVLNRVGYTKSEEIEEKALELVEKTISPADPDSWFRAFGEVEDSPFINMSVAGMEQAYLENPIVYACCNLISQAFQTASLAIKVYNPKEEKWEIKQDSSYTDPFKTNPWLSEALMLQYMSLSVKLTGMSYIWVLRDGRGAPVEYWTIPSSWVTLQESVDMQDGNRIVASYSIMPDGPTGSRFDIIPEDMVYTRYPDPSSLYLAASPLSAASKSLQLDSQADNFKGESLENLSLPGIKVSTLKPLNARQKEDLRASLKAKTGRKASNNAVLVSGAEAKVEVLNPLEKFSWKDFNEENITRICGVFGVPPLMIHSVVGLENSPWSNVGEARKTFYRTTIAAMWKMFGDSLTHTLIPLKDQKRFKIVFDTTEVEELKEDASDKEDRVIKLVDAGIITVNQGLEMLDLEIATDGDVYKVSNNIMFVEEGDRAEIIEPLSDEENNTDFEEMIDDN